MLAIDRARAWANVDECRSEFGAGVAGGRTILLPGDRVVVRGWAHTHVAHKPSVVAIVGERRIPLEGGIERLDMVPAHGPEAAQSGFEGLLEGLDAIAGPFEVIVAARFGRGPERTIGLPHRFIGVAEPLASVPQTGAGRSHGRVRRLADTRPEPFPEGWTGRRSIRPGAAIEVAGWVLDAQNRPPDEVVVDVVGRDFRAAFAAGLVGDGEATLVARSGDWFEAGFRCVIDPEPFPPGLYDATVLARYPGGAWERGPSAAFQIPPLVAEIAPIFLALAAEPAPCALERIEPLDPLCGEPVAVAGWARDPADGRGGAVYVAFDEGHPLPVPSRLPRPDLADQGDPDAGFAGIADTAGLAPGPHRLRLLLEANYAGLWHVLDEREVIVRPD